MWATKTLVILARSCSMHLNVSCSALAAFSISCFKTQLIQSVFYSYIAQNQIASWFNACLKVTGLNIASNVLSFGVFCRNASKDSTFVALSYSNLKRW
jgi:hypothetical protein